MRLHLLAYVVDGLTQTSHSILDNLGVFLIFLARLFPTTLIDRCSVCMLTCIDEPLLCYSRCSCILVMLTIVLVVAQQIEHSLTNLVIFRYGDTVLNICYNALKNICSHTVAAFGFVRYGTRSKSFLSAFARCEVTLSLLLQVLIGVLLREVLLRSIELTLHHAIISIF